MSKFAKYLYPLLLFSILLLITVSNYKPGTWLMGWDSLHPELNFKANFLRSIYSTWQEYQGLGLLAGMAHAADLPRQGILYLLSFIFPLSTLRYIWHFGMLYLGTFSCYLLFKTQFQKNRSVAFFGSLSYLLHYGIIQYLNLTFDPYITFFGFFPLLLHFFLYPKKYYLTFFLLNLIASPLAYVQTIFLVYIICLSLASFFANNKKNKFAYLLLVLLANSYWLLPNIYFTATSVKVTQTSAMNLLVTDQFQEENYATGNLLDSIQKKSPYLNQTDQNKNQNLFETWKTWRNNKMTLIFECILFIISALGVLLYKDNSKRVYISFFIFTAAGLSSNILFFEQANQILNQLPLVSQIFRNSFTKLIVPSALSYSFFLASGLFYLQKKLETLKIITFSFLMVILITPVAPVFFGYYFNEKIKVTPPVEYFSLIQYFHNQPKNSRILFLPQDTIWGWWNYTWGYSGSGFLFYAIEQPTMERAFDVWSDKLENFYWQLKYAINKNDPILFQQLLSRYRITHVVFDTSAFQNPNNYLQNGLYNKKLIEMSPTIEQDKNFISQDISIYKNLTLQDNLKIQEYESMPEESWSENFSYYDPNFPDYINTITPQKTLGTLFSSRTETPSFKITEDLNQINVSSQNQTKTFQPFWQICSSSSGNKSFAQNNFQTSYFKCPETDDLTSGFLIKIVNINISNKPTYVTVFTRQNNKILIDSRINQKLTSNNYYFIPPLDTYDQGISLNLVSKSFSNQSSQNIVQEILITKVDPNIFPSISKYFPTINHSSSNYQNPNYTYYYLNPKPNTKIIVQNQSYDRGWVAFCNSKKITFLKHRMANSWSNAWETNQDCQNQIIHILYLPQLFEYLGFILILFTFPVLLFLQPRQSS